MSVTVLLAALALVELAGLIALGVLLIVSRRQLKGARTALERIRSQGNRRRRRRPGVAPFAIRTAFKTADSLISKGIGATVRNSVEDLAGWAQVERPDLARLTADGKLDMDAYFGWDYHSDYHLKHSKEFMTWLKGQGFTAPVASWDA
ncbi:MAG: adenylate cyclase, partial [Mycobacterium sp.]|nr:adenylate cyclase [Mycobacterium sp.]